MKRAFAFAVLFVLMSLAGAANAAPPTPFDAFNDQLASATRRMDNAAMLALWDEDGASLLPGTAPMVGKPAIARFLATVGAQLHAAHMQRFDLACRGAVSAGDWGSEWCDEHQVVVFANGQPTFDGRGRMLLVLHRGADGHWRIHREMWQSLKPS